MREQKTMPAPSPKEGAKAESETPEVTVSPEMSQEIPQTTPPLDTDFEDGTKIVKVKSGSIKVVALRDGLYKQRRLFVGDIFTIDDEKQLGTWMKKI